MLTIKILGSGCANCKKVESLAQRTVQAIGVEAQIVKVTDFAEIARFHVLATPGLVINDRVVCAGRVPNESEITGWLKAVGTA